MEGLSDLDVICLTICVCVFFISCALGGGFKNE